MGQTMLGVHLLDRKAREGMAFKFGDGSNQEIGKPEGSVNPEDRHAGSYTTIWAACALTFIVRPLTVFGLAYGWLTARLQIIPGMVTKAAKRSLGVRDDFVSIESLWARLRIVDGSVADVRHSKIHFYYKSSDGMGDRFATRYLLNVSYVFYDGYCRNRGDFTFNFSSCALREFRTR